MNTDSVANRLFMEMCWHRECELGKWYEDGLELAHAQITEPIVASTTGEAEEEIRGCECCDLRDLRATGLPLFCSQAQDAIYHDRGRISESGASVYVEP